MLKVITKSARQTKRIAATLARKITRNISKHGAQIVALKGNLGAGKTTFAQGFAKALGVKEHVVSPTFVLIKIYGIRRAQYKYFIHIDCYRLKSARDFLHLGVAEMFRDRNAIILIEWPERIERMIPRHARVVSFAHGTNENERRIIATI